MLNVGRWPDQMSVVMPAMELGHYTLFFLSLTPKEMYLCYPSNIVTQYSQNKRIV